MRHVVFLGLLGLILAGVISPTWAYGQPGIGPGEFQDQLLQIKRVKLGAALGVDQSTVDRLIQIDQKYGPLKAQSIREAKAAMLRLQQIMQNPNPPEGEVRVTLNEIIQKEKETLNLKQRQLEEEMAILTPVQEARYIMFLMSMRREINREARTLRGGPGEAAPMTPKPREIPVVRPTR